MTYPNQQINQCIDFISANLGPIAEEVMLDRPELLLKAMEILKYIEKEEDKKAQVIELVHIIAIRTIAWNYISENELEEDPEGDLEE